MSRKEAVLVWAVTVVAMVALASWAYLAVGHGGFWLAAPGPPRSPHPAEWPEVVAETW